MRELKDLYKLEKQIRKIGTLASPTLERAEQILDGFEKLAPLEKNSSLEEDWQFALDQIFYDIYGYYMNANSERLIRGTQTWENIKIPFIDFGRESAGLYSQAINSHPSQQNSIHLNLLRTVQKELENDHKFRVI